MAVLSKRDDSPNGGSSTPLRRGLRVAHSREETNASVVASHAAREARAGKHPLKLYLPEGTRDYGHVTLCTLFEHYPNLDRIMIEVYHNGFKTIDDLNGARVDDIFANTGAGLHEQRFILEQLKQRIGPVLFRL